MNVEKVTLNIIADAWREKCVMAKYRKQKKQKKSRALAPFDRDKKRRQKYKAPKERGEKRKKS
ncbi:hypothetical protein BCON_0133g00290 [Botryotinia convoluta]|uniref:Uncharacterized protein n=1 Tax=Botryotinia convoluta TaxID=54673 RepID=A0A4Z1HVT7_9HELO|nr:hypothetical protein BCON_0133g00290 [Botryotinia convoluta]